MRRTRSRDRVLALPLLSLFSSFASARVVPLLYCRRCLGNYLSSWTPGVHLPDPPPADPRTWSRNRSFPLKVTALLA